MMFASLIKNNYIFSKCVFLLPSTLDFWNFRLVTLAKHLASTETLNIATKQQCFLCNSRWITLLLTLLNHSGAKVQRCILRIFRTHLPSIDPSSLMAPLHSGTAAAPKVAAGRSVVAVTFARCVDLLI